MGNEPDEFISKPWKGCLFHSAPMSLEKAWMGNIVGKNGLFSLRIATSLGKEKMNIQINSTLLKNCPGVILCQSW